MQSANPLDYITCSPEETLSVAKKLAPLLKQGDVITLEGALGAGKTTFAKGLIHALTDTHIDEITSPTFTYLTVYKGPVDLHHFDAYRINSESTFEAMGLVDYINDESIALIEWPSRIPSYSSSSTVSVQIDYASDTERKITIAICR